METEQKILRLFLYKEKLKFSDIEKSLGLRSNKLAYRLKTLLEKEILRKEKNLYVLAKENLLPYLSEKDNALPVILIHIGNKGRCLLYKRQKRPFKDKLGLPGGRTLVGETLQKATARIMKEKFKIKCKLKKIHSVSLEQIKNATEVFQTDLIIFASAETGETIGLTDIKKNKSKIISSDYKLLTQDLEKEVHINNFSTKN